MHGLTKIFGPQAHAHLAAVHAGLGRDALRERHGHVLALHDVSLEAPGGAVTVVMGLSGSGKSTLLRHLNRLVEPTAGRVRAGDVDVTALAPAALQAFRRTHMAMVFQRYALWPHRSVLRNVQYPLALQGLAPAAQEAAARRWIERVGLAGFETRFPSALSGGMQQRVGLARALAGNAPILLLDEPFSALDPLTRTGMQELLLGLQRELRKTVVFITHDLDEALRLGERIVILRDGRVVQQGAPADIVLRPADEYVQRFVRDVNRGRVLRCGALMQPGPAAGPVLAADATLADAARAMLAAGAQEAQIRTADGRIGGRLALADVVAQLAA